MKTIEPLPWRGVRALDKLILALLLLSATAVLVLPFLDLVFVRRLARLTGARALLAWLVNDNGAWIAGAALLALAGLYALWVRHRLVTNRMLWFGTGCPNCMERELVRVSRKPKDRLYGLLAIPAYRYACRNCTWRGLRIARREHSRERDAELEAALLRFQPDGVAAYPSANGTAPEVATALPSTALGIPTRSAMFRDPGDVGFIDEPRIRELIDELGDDETGEKDEELSAEEVTHIANPESIEGMEWLWRRSSDD